MPLIRYDIVEYGGGWSIALGGAIGSPYLTQAEAVRQVAYTALSLKAGGDEVVIHISDRHGQRAVCDTRNPRYRETLLRLRS